MVLFINACLRENSRTKELAECLLTELGDEVNEIILHDEEIPSLTEETIISRREAAHNGDKTDPFVSMALEFGSANRIVIAAPYWDLSFPAVLKKYIEAIMVEGITFEYDESGRPIGLCCADTLYYITTSGGKIIEPDCGYTYIQNLAKKMLGISNTHCFYAEGLDIVGADVEDIIAREKEQIQYNFFLGNSIKNILIVDDSKVNILKAEHILKEYDYITFTATSGQECLSVLRKRKMDAVLLDIEMPEMDGFEVLHAIRANPEWNEIPVIFVTGDKSMDAVLRASQEKVSGYVVKPFSEEELIGKVRKLSIDG